MKRLLGILALILLLAACGRVESGTFYVEPLEGEEFSPDGQFYAQGLLEGGEGYQPGETYPPDVIRISTLETDIQCWQGDAGLKNSILWSPEGGFAAIARTARTWCSILVLETENWTSWDFALPDGSPIPEYTFLPDDEPWGVWTSEGSLDLTIGRGGDAGEQRYYACSVNVSDGKIEGHVWEESREPLPEDYDFNHDGEPEMVGLTEAYGDEVRNQVGWYEIQVRTRDNRFLWSRSCSTSHPGWESYFACRADGKDYLLRYTPTMYQGFATYAYELFFLNEEGKEQIVQEGGVDFDLNFGSSMHESYDPEAVAAFLEEVHGLLEDSELLLTTESGEVRSGGPGADFRDDLELWTSEDLYDDGKSLEENIRIIGEFWKEIAE